LSLLLARLIFAAKGGFNFTFEDGKRFLEVVAMRRRPAAWRNMHVDEAKTTVGVVASKQSGVSVSHDSDVRKTPVFVRARNREIALEIIRRDRRDGLGCEGVVVHDWGFTIVGGSRHYNGSD
jgi:hypothetical protein